jgi:methylmalonyl-CoA mutase N-terminal domain/subunit
VGINEFKDEHQKIEIPLLEISPEVEKKQVERLSQLRKDRNNQAVKEGLAKLKSAAENNKNLMPVLVECAKAYATVGEMVNILKEVFGEYVEPADF